MNSIFSGFAGLFLFLGNWLSPTEKGELKVAPIQIVEERLIVSYELQFRWSDDATSIIDAGIPLRILHRYKIDGEIKEEVVRTLIGDVEKFVYHVYDSSATSVSPKKEYANIYVALKAYKKREWEHKAGAQSITISAMVLPAPVPSLNRTVDLSPICGGGYFRKKIELEDR